MTILDCHSQQALDNLVAIKQLHKEPPNQAEFDGMVKSASVKLHDAQLKGLSTESQFTLAYGAAHGFSLAALRWYGYRADSRYLVFQSLQHTLNLPATQWRVFDACHHRRNVAEYEGHLEIDKTLLDDLLRQTLALQSRVTALGLIISE